MALRIVNGQQVITAAEAVAGGASAATVSVFLRVNAPIRNNASRFVVFGNANESPWGFSLTQGGQQLLMILMDANNSFPYSGVTVQPGLTCHLLMTWTNGLQSYYVNGKQVATATHTGTLNPSGSTICFGETAYGGVDPGATGLDYEIQDACVAAGYAATKADAVALRDRTRTPAQVFGSKLAFYLPLSGTTGAVAKPGDPGLTDTAGGLAVASVVGSPVYSPGLLYVPPVTASPYVSTSGKTLYFLLKRFDGVNSPGGPQQAGPTLNGAPSVSINGGAAVALPASPAPLAFDNYLSFLLPTPLQPTDTLTVSTPDGWATTADGDAVGITAVPAPRTPIVPPPSGAPTKMALGWNSPDATLLMPTPLFSNTVRIGGWQQWGGGTTYTTDADDNLTNLAGSVITQVAGAASRNGTNKAGYPTPSGVWTVKWTGSTATVTLADLNGVATVTVVPGSQVSNPAGNSCQYMVTAPTTQYYASLYLMVSQGGGTCDLKNLAVYPPGEPTDGSETFSLSLIRQLNKPASIRFMDAIRTNSQNLVAYSQWPGASKVFASTGPAPTVIPLASVTAYTDSEGFFGSLKCLLQFTTAVPHGLVDGQSLRFSGAELVNLTFSDGRTYGLDGLFSLVRVTGPTTFAAFASPQATVTGVHTLTSATATLEIDPPLAVGLMMGLAQRLMANPWVNVPHLLPDAEVRNLAAACAAMLPTGLKLQVERSNETWNQTVAFMQSFYDAGMSALAKTDAASYHAMRTSTIHDIFASELAKVGRGADLIRVVGSQWGSVDRTRAIVAWYVANGKRFDALAIAPYFDNGPVGSGFDAYWSAADIDQVFDAAGLFLAHSNNYTQAVANHAAAISPVTGSTLVCYEGSLEQGCPQGTNYDVKCRAFVQHPKVGPFLTQYFRQQESQGATLFNYYSLAVPLGGDQNLNFSLCYNPYYGPTTMAGTGDGSDGQYDNRNGFDLTKNVSVIGYTINQWMAGATVKPANPVRPKKNWYPVGTRGHSRVGR